MGGRPGSGAGGRALLFGHPLVWPAACYLAGLALVQGLPQLLPWPPLWGLAAGGLVLAWTLWQGARRGAFPRAWLCLGLFLLAGGWLGWQRAQPLEPDHLRRHADNQLHHLEAQVVGAPEPLAHGWRLLARARALDGQPASGLLRLSLPPAPGPPRVGHVLAARVRLRPVTGFANPGVYDFSQDLAAQEDLYVQAGAGKTAGLTDLGPGPGGGSALAGLRQDLGGLLDGLAPGPGRALLRALVLGQRGELAPQEREAFNVTGTAHLLAISGLHLGLVWGWCYALLRLGLAAWPGLALRWPAPKLAAALALLPAAAYTLVAGGSLPTLRALIMAACLVLALGVGRPYRSLGGLALAALVIGLAWPQAPLTLSFQMSFVAVAAILLAAAPLAGWVARRPGGWRWLWAFLAWLCVSGVTGLALLPLTLLHFHNLPWLSLPANALLIPLVAMLVLPLGLSGAALSLLWPGGGAWILGLAAWPARVAVELAVWLAGLPGAVSYLAGPGPLVVALIYLTALMLLALPAPWRWWLGASGTWLALALGLVQAQGPPPDGRLTVWVLDVGQGSAAVLRLPQGQVLVVDGGGGLGGLDTGQRVVAPFLWSQGLGSLEALACSHAHPDHAGGLPFLARWLAPRQVWTNGEPADGGPYGRLLAQAARQGIPVLTPAQLARLEGLGGASLRLAWPRPGTDLDEWDENDGSLWLGFGLGQTWLWLPGDAGPKIERLVAPGLPEGGEQVLVAPHHGGKGSCGEPLLKRLRPRAVIYSAGCGNVFGQPRADSRARAAQAGAQTFCTSQQGCVKLVSDGQAWSITPFLDPPRDCALPQ